MKNHKNVIIKILLLLSFSFIASGNEKALKTIKTDFLNIEKSMEYNAFLIKSYTLLASYDNGKVTDLILFYYNESGSFCSFCAIESNKSLTINSIISVDSEYHELLMKTLMLINSSNYKKLQIDLEKTKDKLIDLKKRGVFEKSRRGWVIKIVNNRSNKIYFSDLRLSVFEDQREHLLKYIKLLNNVHKTPIDVDQKLIPIPQQ